MATKRKTKKADGGLLTWAGALPLRVVLADGSTAIVQPGGSFEPSPEWLEAVRERQPEKAAKLK